jgi:hypothetical protein
MADIPAVSAATLAQIAALEVDVLGRLGKPSARAQQFPPDLEARRQELLTEHLGFHPQSPLPVLHVLGDSHVAFFSGVEGLKFYSGRGVLTGFFRRRYISAFTELLPVFRVFHTGASTAWSAAAPRSASQTRQKIAVLLRKDIPAGGSLLLVFGEIDCRSHIPKAVLGGKAIPTAAGETVARFMALPRWLAQAGYDVTVWQPSGVTVADATPPEIYHPQPAFGTQQLRLEITRAYSEQLAAACAREKIRCAGIVGKYHSWNEPAAAECFLDNCHLSQRMMPLTLHALRDSGALSLSPAPGAVCPLAG